jgi:pheromone a factor receptor
VLSSNRVANYRAQRARRRLYLMVVSVLVPYFPVVVTMFIMNIRMMGPLNPYRYEDVHHSMWDNIILMPSTKMSFLHTNHAWITILSAIPVIIFFGMTKEAMNDYRRVLLFFGLGRFFPGLHCEYDPDVPGFADGSFGSSHSATNSGYVAQRKPPSSSEYS